MKFELVALQPSARHAGELQKRASATIDDVGKEASLSVYQGREVLEKKRIDAQDMQGAVRAALDWLRQNGTWAAELEALEFAAVRVVHGGTHFAGPAEATREVRQTISDLRELAPLHNQSSLTVLEVLDRELGDRSKMVAFDTAFHRTLPEVAWRYPIERETADKYGVRKFGFHGLSHRYLLNAYAAAVGKAPEACTLISMHLESGSSACAVRNGQSVDTTMGLTPLEGLMMGSRCGSVDPAIVPYLMGKQAAGVDEIMKMLEKKSGLLGVAGNTLDTRVLVKRKDRWARLALEMFSYRVRLAVGAYLATLGSQCEAILFGGGIGEDSPWLRTNVCSGLEPWGLTLDQDVNTRTTEGQACLTTKESRLQAWSMASEEGLQMAWECMNVRHH